MCNEYEEIIRKAIDQEISLEEQEKLVAHFQECKECMAEYEALKTLKSWLSHLEKSSLPEGFHQELMHKVVNQEGPNTLKRSKYKRIFLQAGSVAVASVLVGVAFFDQLNKESIHHPLTVTHSQSSEPVEKFANPIQSRHMPEQEMMPYLKWTVQSEDSEQIIREFEQYLIQQHISHQWRNHEVIIKDGQYNKLIYEWLLQQQLQIVLSDEENTIKDLPVCIEFLK